MQKFISTCGVIGEVIGALLFAIGVFMGAFGVLRLIELITKLV